MDLPVELATAVAFLVACGHDGRQPDRPPPPKAQTTGEVAGPQTAPPGTADLVHVPDAVAAQVTLREVARGLQRPVLVTFAPGDARKRLFVVEQRGAIRVIEHGLVTKQLFFTIPDLSDGAEQGLLGLAFHPRFADNGKLYVNYTSRDMATHIVEYRVTKNPDAVDPTTARELVRIEQPYSNHNGGNLVFGPDGKLYTGMGDGGSAGDPHKNGQNPRALLAKLLRFDVDADKPEPEIVHIGLRNPWRFWFDAKTHDLYIGDVGQNLWEEIDVAPAGSARLNFGWNVMEGTHCYDAEDCDRSGLTLPVAEYSHEQGCSVTGGVTYRGKELAKLLDGRYFYADYCTGLLRSFLWTSGYVREHWDWKPVPSQVSSFGTDEDGEVYIVLLTGTISRLAPGVP
jgi:glucose/arabinose dehydrogenase